AVLVYALAPATLLGWPMKLDAQARWLLPRVSVGLPYLGKLAGRGSTVTTESLLALHPDLVLDAGSVDPTYLSGAERVWQQTRLPYVLIDGQLQDHPAQLREVGRLLGVPARGEALAAGAERILALARQVRAGVPEAERPRVYYGRDPDGLLTGLEGSINMQAIALAGGRNVAAQAGRGGLTRVSMEQVLAWDPEVIVTQDPAFAGSVLQNPLWRAVSAVRAGRVHLAPSVPFGWLDGPPSVNRLLGVHWLLSKLYPGRDTRLAPAQMAAAVSDFHRQLYGSAPPDGFLPEAAELPA
ncbi:MAG: ABC transporter substrate-binding protein, partial [Stenotrophomonas sp.]